MAYIAVTAAGLYALYYFLFLVALENLAALAWIVVRWSRARRDGTRQAPGILVRTNLFGLARLATRRR